MDAFTGGASFVDDVNDYSDDFIDDDDYNIDGYKFIRKLGAGASGIVVELEKDNVHYAAKVCNVRRGNVSFLHPQTGDPKEEAAILLKLANPHVVKVHQLVEDTDNDRIFIIMDLLTGGTMDNCETPESKRKAFGQLLEGVQYIHRQRLAHRDIKLENVMLSGDGCAKLCDFGIAVYAAAGNNMIPVEMKGTPAYQAPEMFTEAKYDPFKADIWALGVLLYNLMFGEMPFQAENIFMFADVVQRVEPDYPRSADRNLVALIKSMLKKNPDERATIDQIWLNEWMDGLKPRFAMMLLNFQMICQTIVKAEIANSVQKVKRGKVAHAHMKANDHVKEGLAKMFKLCKPNV